MKIWGLQISDWSDDPFASWQMAALVSGKVCVFGAGGPVGTVAATALKRDYTLRLTDVQPVEEILERGEPQNVGAPLPEVPEPSASVG